jgi:RNA polymerase sigma factor (sigma-70 family)
MQEVFLRAHRYRKSFRGDSSPLAWLFTITDRCFFDLIRKKVEPVSNNEVENFIRDEHEGAEKVFLRHDLVAKLLARAPKDVRQIVIHRYFDELEHKQIAARLNINEKTVRRKLEKFLVTARKFSRRV